MLTVGRRVNGFDWILSVKIREAEVGEWARARRIWAALWERVGPSLPPAGVGGIAPLCDWAGLASRAEISEWKRSKSTNKAQPALSSEVPASLNDFLVLVCLSLSGSGPLSSSVSRHCFHLRWGLLFFAAGTDIFLDSVADTWVVDKFSTPG